MLRPTLPYYDSKRVGSFRHGHIKDRVRGRRARRSNDILVQIRDHEGYGPDLHVKPEEFLRVLRHLSPRPQKGAPPTDIARYIAWLGKKGTLVAASLHRYLSVLHQQVLKRPRPTAGRSRTIGYRIL